MVDAATRAVLNKSENLLVAETERVALKSLDEEAAIELEGRVRRARDKYVGIYRRTARGAVGEKGGRGKARPENSQNARRAEAFERALSRVSRRVGALAQESAAALRTERLEMAREAKQRDYPGSSELVPRQGRRAHVDPSGPEPPSRPRGERALRNPATEAARADTQAKGARRQGRRDSKRLAPRYRD